MGDQEEIERFERDMRDPAMEWSQYSCWVAMDAVLLAVAEEQIEHYNAMVADAAVEEAERAWRTLGYAGAAILLVCAAMEGHLNFQCRRWLADVVGRKHPADQWEADYLVELLWETSRKKERGGRPHRNLGELEKRLRFQDKWRLLFKISSAGDALSLTKPPLKTVVEAMNLRNSFLAHPKLKPLTVRAAKSRGSGSRIAWAPPDVRLFAETREITISKAKAVVDAAKETFRLLHQALGGPEVPDWGVGRGGLWGQVVIDPLPDT